MKIRIEGEVEVADIKIIDFAKILVTVLDELNLVGGCKVLPGFTVSNAEEATVGSFSYFISATLDKTDTPTACVVTD